jgi:hypothetical protein
MLRLQEAYGARMKVLPGRGTYDPYFDRAVIIDDEKLGKFVYAPKVTRRSVERAMGDFSTEVTEAIKHEFGDQPIRYVFENFASTDSGNIVDFSHHRIDTAKLIAMCLYYLFRP